MDAIRLGYNIRTERKKQKLTIAQLAEKADISDNFMGNIERGVDTPSVDTLIRISNALLVPIDVLLASNLEVFVDYKDVNDDKCSIAINKYLKTMSQTQKECVLNMIKIMNKYGDK